ncbi:hypothetical protein LZ31DRAFT_331803 [Colletotrichum somersetense]|nr:hypothetical protein LZ31DRAFT_331803 [Colletotrichum somersetense]
MRIRVPFLFFHFLPPFVGRPRFHRRPDRLCPFAFSSFQSQGQLSKHYDALAARCGGRFGCARRFTGTKDVGALRQHFGVAGCSLSISFPHNLELDGPYDDALDGYASIREKVAHPRPPIIRLHSENVPRRKLDSQALTALMQDEAVCRPSRTLRPEKTQDVRRDN